LDIGTEYIKTLIFEIKNEKAQIMGVGRQRQKLTEMRGGTVLDIEGVVKNATQAIAKAEEMAGFDASQVIVGIAGELVKGITTTVHYTRSKPKAKLNYDELKSIVDKVQRRAFDKARETLAMETGHSEIDVKLVNAAIIDVKIDGYRVTNPVGFQGRDVSVSVFNAFAPIVHLGALQTITEELDLDLIAIAAEPYAVAKAVGLEESLDYSAIFMDIGGGTTDIAVVRNGGLEGTKMIAIGGRSFTKRLSQVLNVPFETAEEIKISYSNGLLDKKSAKIMHEALYSDCKVLISGVELTLEEFSEDDLLPSRILLCGGASALPEVREALEKEKWASSVAFAKKPRVDFIRTDEVLKVEDITGKLKNPQDITPMALANTALDFAGSETVVEGILDKVVKSLRE
jgi:cell division protein FtsA